MSDKEAILADLRSKPYGKGSVLYAADIAEELKKTPGAVYKLLKGGLADLVIQVGGRPAINVHAWAAYLAGEEPAATKESKPEPGKPASVQPKWKVNKDIAKAMNMFRGQRDFLTELEAELERLVLADAADEKATEEIAQKLLKKGLADRTDIL